MKTPEPVRTPRPEPESAAAETSKKRAAFERPRVRRLGALPAVTTAFGGSFTP